MPVNKNSLNCCYQNPDCFATVDQHRSPSTQHIYQLTIYTLQLKHRLFRKHILLNLPCVS